MSETPMYVDARDEQVIEQLEEGTVYGVTHLKNLYLGRTDIRQEGTAKRRKNSLVKSPAFENVGIGKFRYLGIDKDGT